MSPTRGYSSYRGRSPLWKKVVAVLLVLVILAAMGVIALQNCIVYDEAGRARIELPWEQEEPETDTSSSGSDSEELNITVEEAVKAPEELRGAQIAAAPLTMKDWQEENDRVSVISPQAGALALTVKESSGRVCYDSPAARAVSGSIIKADSGTGEAIAAMNGAWDYTIARVSCLLDPIAAKADVEGLGLKNTGGYVFYDGNNLNWLDPAKVGTMDYLCSIAEECAAMGFDEILLTNLSYPTVGKLDKIDYGENVDRQEALENLVDAVTKALAADYPEVRVSVELPAEVITAGADGTAGLVLEDMACRVDRVYAVTTAEEAQALAQAVKDASASVDFVAEVTSPEDITGSYLLINGQ